MKAPSAILLAALLVGCGTTADQRCGAYRATYEAYQASQAFRKPSAQEIDAAAAAGVFLKLWCGWQATRGNDSNGVPIVTPP